MRSFEDKIDLEQLPVLDDVIKLQELLTYDIRLEYREVRGAASVQVRWGLEEVGRLFCCCCAVAVVSGGKERAKVATNTLPSALAPCV